MSHLPTTTFHLFPLLPTEIRLKIWAATISPRLFILSFRILPTDTNISFINCAAYPSPTASDIHTNTPLAILSTTRESRAVGLEVHTEAFPSPHGNRTYVNFALDVFLCYDHFWEPRMSKGDHEGLGKVRNLIVRTTRDGFHDPRRGNAFVGPKGMVGMKGVRELTVVLLERVRRFGGGDDMDDMGMGMDMMGGMGMVRSTRANEMLLLGEFEGRGLEGVEGVEVVEVQFLREGEVVRGEEWGGVPRGVRTLRVWDLVREVLVVKIEEEEKRVKEEERSLVERDGLPLE